jgi:hypothetical protein
MYVNGKMIPVETMPGIEGGGNKGEWWRGWFQVWHTLYIVRTFVIPQSTPTQHNKKNKDGPSVQLY